MAIAPMKVAQIPKGGADFQIVEREIPTPGVGHVRIKVHACGVCHSDVLTKEGSWPGIQYPRVPGHEVAGIIDELGAGVSEWKKGQRVGVGWHPNDDRRRFLRNAAMTIAAAEFVTSGQASQIDDDVTDRL